MCRGRRRISMTARLPMSGPSSKPPPTKSGHQIRRGALWPHGARGGGRRRTAPRRARADERHERGNHRGDAEQEDVADTEDGVADGGADAVEPGRNDRAGATRHAPARSPGRARERPRAYAMASRVPLHRHAAGRVPMSPGRARASSATAARLMPLVRRGLRIVDGKQERRTSYEEAESAAKGRRLIKRRSTTLDHISRDSHGGLPRRRVAIIGSAFAGAPSRALTSLR